MNTGERLVSLKDFAKRIGVHTRTVYRMINDGQLPKPIKVRSRSMMRESWIERIIKEGTR